MALGDRSTPRVLPALPTFTRDRGQEGEVLRGLGDSAGEEEPHPYVIQVVPASSTWGCSRITARAAPALRGWTRVCRDS